MSAAVGTRLFGEQLARLEAAWVALPDKPDESPEATLRALWRTAAGDPCSAARAAGAPLPPLGRAGERRLRELVALRVARTPLAHLTGRQEFMGLELLSGPEALIPRRETELLARVALEGVRAAVAERGSAAVLDVCTGSGNVALALAAHEPAARVFAADLAPEAVELARRNAGHLGLAGRVAFAAGNLFAPFDAPPFLGAMDAVTCNPPYISSARVPGMADEIAAHEPRLAFDGGTFGVDVLLNLIADAPRFLRPGGWLCFEVGVGQGPGIAARMSRRREYTEIRSVADESGTVRVLAARTA